MALISETDYIMAKARYDRIPTDRIYSRFGIQVRPAYGNKIEVTESDGGGYLSDEVTLKMRLEADLLQQHFNLKTGQQALGAMTVLEQIEAEIAAERQSNNTAA